MAYDPAEPTAVDRIRGRLGDTKEPPKLRGGEVRYQGILDVLDGDEEYAGRKAAAALAAQIAQEPDSLTDAGSGIKWSARIPQLNLIAQGKDVVAPTSSSGGGSGAEPVAGSGDTSNQAVW